MLKLQHNLFLLRTIFLTLLLSVYASMSWAAKIYVNIGTTPTPSSYYYPSQVAWVPGHWYYGRWIPGHYVEYAPPSPGPGYIWYQGGWDNRGQWHRGYWKHRHHHHYR
jgi:hypothetical protein